MDLGKSNLLKQLITIKSTNDFLAHIRSNIPEEPTLTESQNVSGQIIDRLKQSLTSSNSENIKVYYSPNSISGKAPPKSQRVSGGILDIKYLK